MATALIALTLSVSRMLVFQRRDDHTRVYPNMLTLFGGKIEPDEAPLAAAMRELQEETSLRPHDSSELHSVGQFEVPLSDGRLIDIHLFQYEIADDDFDVFEGTGHETYHLEVALARPDVAEVAVTLLRMVEAQL
jgi:8-oxo-dGTP pyrophosphatase MutT (NUDIX family)